MKTNKQTLFYTCFFASVMFLFIAGCETNQTSSSTICDCSQMTVSDNEDDGKIVNATEAIALNDNYVNYINALYISAGIPSTPVDFIKGGRIKKADLIAIINSLPDGQQYVNFGFGRANAVVETAGSAPYAKTYVLFYGGDLNPCKNTTIPAGQQLIYRNGFDGGFCPPMCDTSVHEPIPDGSVPTDSVK